jgi:hypothetical protein
MEQARMSQVSAMLVRKQSAPNHDRACTSSCVCSSNRHVPYDLSPEASEFIGRPNQKALPHSGRPPLD